MLWGSRFEKKLDQKAFEFSSSLNIDIRLLEYDIKVSKAHAKMLADTKIISNEDSDKIIKGLESISNEWKSNDWNPIKEKYEDVHSAIESKLKERIGETAGKLHTGRSRNDLVSTSFRLWVKDHSKGLIDLIKYFQRTLIQISEEHVYTVMPGYTHLQRAQPISLAFHLLAYVEMMERDKKRFAFVINESNVMPLGSGALAGSSLPLNRNITMDELGFAYVSNNALDAVSDRDFVIDFLNACSITMSHLSRLSEEIVLWSGNEFNFLKLIDQFTTGSSLMPQKKNPDIAELIRGKSAKVIGNLFTISAMMKGLPLSYNRDMQEDKEPSFNSYDILSTSLQLISEMMITAEFNKERFIEELKIDSMVATDIVDWLVTKDIPFREAHKIVGEIVKYSERNNKPIQELSILEFIEINENFDESILEVMKIENILSIKKTEGSPNPKFVKQLIQQWKFNLS